MKTTVNALLVLVLCCSARLSQAGLIINVNEVGPDIGASYSGSINLDATLGSIVNDGYGNPNSTALCCGGLFVLGSGTNSFWDISGSSDTPFITGSVFNFASTGDKIGLDNLGGVGLVLALPTNYVSGSSLSGTATILSSSFASLGLTGGEFQTNFSNPTNQASDFVRIVVGGEPSPVPAPATLALLILGLIGLRLRRKA